MIKIHSLHSAQATAAQKRNITKFDLPNIDVLPLRKVLGRGKEGLVDKVVVKLEQEAQRLLTKAGFDPQKQEVRLQIFTNLDTLVDLTAEDEIVEKAPYLVVTIRNKETYKISGKNYDTTTHHAHLIPARTLSQIIEEVTG